MADFTYDGSTSRTIEFDPSVDTLQFTIGTRQFTNVSQDEDGVRFTTVNGTVLLLAGATYESLSQNPDAISLPGIGSVIFASETGTIQGTDGADIILGTDGADQILGGDGNNLIFGGGTGANPDDQGDEITTGRGDDTIYGNGGDDFIYSNGGNDVMVGGLGADRIYTNPDLGQTVTVYGASAEASEDDGGDVIVVANFVDRGEETFLPSAGAAFVSGNGGDDQIYVLANGDNTIYAGAGSDYVQVGFEGATGSNLVYGGRNAEGVTETIFVQSDGDNTVYGGRGANDSADGAESINVFGDGNNEVYANGGDDEAFVSGDGDNTIYGGFGNDGMAVSGSGSNLIYGGQGSDEIDVEGDGDNTIYGGVGNFDPDDQADEVSVVGDGDNAIYVNGGDDRVSVNGDGDNTVYGGFGNDEIVLGGQEDDGEIIELAALEEDRVRANGDNLVVGGQGLDRILIYGDGDNTVYGGTGQVDALDDDDVIFVQGSGDNLLFGNAGNDRISVVAEEGGTTGSTTIYGGLGADILLAYDGAEGTSSLLVGGSGTDEIYSSTAGDVTIYGGIAESDPTDLADYIVSSVTDGGSAFISSNAGNDEVYAYVTTTDAETVSSTTVLGGNGDDYIQIVSNGDSVVEARGGVGSDEIDVTMNGDGLTTVYGGLGANDPTDGPDLITVRMGADAQAEIYGNGGDDRISVSFTSSDEDATGSASILAGVGNDEVVVSGGSSGNTIEIFGATGRDVLDVSGYEGQATLTGGADADTFVVSDSQAETPVVVDPELPVDGDPIELEAVDTIQPLVTITDFETGVDTIDFGNLAGTSETFAAGGEAVANYDAAFEAATMAFMSDEGPSTYSLQSVGSDSYLFVDADQNGTVDNIVLLTGVGQDEFKAGDITGSNILAA